ncbi:MAG: hypothetical protein SYR96_27170 [Actinomycetota bacterium]|nr:hypothetical protein [Actinomycetota bacterium]
MPSLAGQATHLIVVLFAAMAVVCVATVTTAVIRINETERTAEGAGDDRYEAERELVSTREQLAITEQKLAAAEEKQTSLAGDLASARAETVAVSVSSLRNALTNADGQNAALPSTICEGFSSCGSYTTETVRLTTCDGKPCFEDSTWFGSTPMTLSYNDGTWSGSGTLDDELTCEGTRDSGTWAFDATVTQAQYSLAGGWEPVEVNATLHLENEAGGNCQATKLRWSGVVAI